MEWAIGVGAIGFTTALVLIGILSLILLRSRRSAPTDYRSLFQLGIVFTLVGATMLLTVGPAGIGITALGLIWLVHSIVNRDKWEER